MAIRTITLRRDDACTACQMPLPAGSQAGWDRASKTRTCLTCLAGSEVEATEPPPVGRGTPGASAAREYDRRRTAREERIRTDHPRLGGLILALSDEPQHIRAWDRGRGGEQAVADLLEDRTKDSPVVLLHDRRVPGSRANIDHLAIAPTGVYIIDAKDWTGKVAVDKPLLGKPKLRIAGRDQTKLIDGLDRQIDAVTAVLDADVPVHGVLCFTKADLPLLGTTRMRGHLLLYRKALAKRLLSDGPLDQVTIDAVAAQLSAALRIA